MKKKETRKETLRKQIMFEFRAIHTWKNQQYREIAGAVTPKKHFQAWTPSWSFSSPCPHFEAVAVDLAMAVARIARLYVPGKL